MPPARDRPPTDRRTALVGRHVRAGWPRSRPAPGRRGEPRRRLPAPCEAMSGATAAEAAVGGAAGSRPTSAASGGPGRWHRVLAETHPDAHCELDHDGAAAARGRHDPLRAVHGQEGQRGDPQAVRPLSDRRRLRRGGPGRAGGDDPADRLLPEQDGRPDQAGSGAGRPVRRRGARPAGRPGHPARHRPQDRQRHPRQRLRRARHHRGHALPAAGPAVGLDRRDRPGQDRARRRRALRAARLDHALAPGDLPRPAGLPRPKAGLRRLHAGQALPVLRDRADRARLVAAKLLKGPRARELAVQAGLDPDLVPASAVAAEAP